MKKTANIFRFISDFFDAIFKNGHDLINKILMFFVVSVICMKLWLSDTIGKYFVICLLVCLVGIVISAVFTKRLDKEIADLKEQQCCGHCKCHQRKSHSAMGREYYKYFNYFISKQNGDDKK